MSNVHCRWTAKCTLSIILLGILPDAITAHMEATGRLTIVSHMGTGGGTLFCIGKRGPYTIFLTAGHCAPHGAELSAEFFRDDIGQNRHCVLPALDVVGNDPAADIAVLRAKTGQAIPVLRILQHGGLPGGRFRVSHVGCPAGSKPVHMEGAVLGGKPGFWAVDMAIRKGCSGGPLVFEGKAIGIASHGSDVGPKYFSHLSAIRQLLKNSGLNDLEGREDVTVREDRKAFPVEVFQPPPFDDPPPDVVKIRKKLQRRHPHLPFPAFFPPPPFLAPPPPPPPFYPPPPFFPPGFWPYP